MSETLFVQGPAGQLQLTLDAPAGAPRGIALISHPQPLLGGSPRHKVPLTLARRLCEAGWLAVRPSFRGVDGSEGVHADGHGETDDTLAIVAELRQRYPGLPLALAGFSFGAYVHARTACALEATQPAEAIVLLGLPVGTVPAGRSYEALPVPARALVVHGEHDDSAPLANLLDWARPEHRPVVLVPGVDHFFKGALEAVVERVLAHL